MASSIVALRNSARALALAVALALACAVAPVQALAADPGIYTATTVPTYANPATGIIEDSGGASNQALGESMVTGTTYDKALVEVDSAGNMYVTMRFKLIDQISDMQFEVSSDGGATFAAAEREQMQTDAAQNTGDFRFQVPDESVVVRVHMDVIPMGRAVVFFVQLSDLVAGNSDTFIQTVDPTAAVVGASDEGASGSDESASAASSAAEEPASQADGSSTNTGVTEYDADGNDVTGGKNAQAGLDGATIGIVIGVAAAVVVVAGVIAYVVYFRPKRAREAQAAAAAAASAASAAAPAPKPSAASQDAKDSEDAADAKDSEDAADGEDAQHAKDAEDTADGEGSSADASSEDEQRG